MRSRVVVRSWRAFARGRTTKVVSRLDKGQRRWHWDTLQGSLAVSRSHDIIQVIELGLKLENDSLPCSLLGVMT